jgi:hypothetical protein
MGSKVRSAAMSNSLKTLNNNEFYIPVNVSGYIRKSITFKSSSKAIELLSEKSISIAD